ncbi:MAG: hypothetical protein ABSG86_25365 [Thermoguttaceae bacterium]|jgi:hypothetical protein
MPAVKPKTPKTLSGKLRAAESAVDACLMAGNHTAAIKAYFGNPDTHDPGENGLRVRLERAHSDPLVAIMRSLARKSQFRRLSGPDAGAMAYNGQ